MRMSPRQMLRWLISETPRSRRDNLPVGFLSEHGRRSKLLPRSTLDQPGIVSAKDGFATCRNISALCARATAGCGYLRRRSRMSSVLNNADDLRPQRRDTLLRLHRHRQNNLFAMRFLQSLERLGQRVAAETIGLRSDHDVRPLHLLQRG